MRSALFFLSAIIGLNLHAQLKASDIVFVEDRIDLGSVRSSDGLISFSYVFVNNGAYDLIIRDVDVACGCTRPEIPKKKVVPGDTGYIHTQFNPKGQHGEVDKWLHLKANFIDVSHIELHFTAVVDDPQVTPIDDLAPDYFSYVGYVYPTNALTFGKVMMGETAQAEVELFNSGQKSFNITEVNAPEWLRLITEQRSIPPQSTLDLIFEYDSKVLDSIGPFGEGFTILTDDHRYKLKEIKYTLDTWEDFSKLKRRQRKRAPHIGFDRTTIDMGTMNGGALVRKKLTISNTGKSPLKIYRVETHCSCAVLDQLPSVIAPGDSITVNVRFDSLFKEGLQRKGITIYTNDPDNPRSVITVRAVVE